MASLDSLRHLTLGQYAPGHSRVHLLDPRAKLVALALLTVAVVVSSWWGATLALVALIGAAYAVAGLSWRHVASSLRPVWPVLGMLAFFQLLFGSGVDEALAGNVLLVSWGGYALSAGRLFGVAVSLARLVSLVLLVNLLTSTTTPSALATGLEMLLRPLNAVGLPGHELALMGSIALRFMPILGEELEAVMRAQTARGAGWADTGRWRLAQNARRVAAVIVPLFADAFRRVEEMTTAMLARCYQGGRGRTHLVHLRLSRADYVAIGASLAALAGAVASRV